MSDGVSKLLLAVIAGCAVALTAAQFIAKDDERPPWTDEDDAVGYYEQRWQIFPVREGQKATHIVRTDQWTGKVDLWTVGGVGGWQALEGAFDPEAAVRFEEEAAERAAEAAERAKEAAAERKRKREELAARRKAMTRGEGAEASP